VLVQKYPKGVLWRNKETDAVMPYISNTAIDIVAMTKYLPFGATRPANRIDAHHAIKLERKIDM